MFNLWKIGIEYTKAKLITSSSNYTENIGCVLQTAVSISQDLRIYNLSQYILR